MATNLVPLPPPINHPLVDENGIVTKPWANFYENVYRYQKVISAAVDDGTYKLGLGSTDGEITITTGIITAIQEVVA